MVSKSYLGTKTQDFVGLSNQGATCYMNSLLQTLFMTPEFRREIYRWKYEPRHGKKEECIPLQLQILFSKLQLSESSSVETTGLTRSFGWTHGESFQQHDVQEFCRVLFDAIEKSVKETSQSQIIQELYEGRYVDYVKCLKCGSESTREDKFLDLSLTIKNTFEKIYNDSIEKALHNFVKPEYLSDGNQYFCERCKSKVDAMKGLKFKELPYILVLQLKRFDFDYNTNHRVKINDKVSFEEIMNLNPLLNQQNMTEVEMQIDKTPDLIPYLERPEMKGKTFVTQIYKKKDHFESSMKKDPLAMDPISMKIYKEKKFQQKQQRRTEKINKFLVQGENVFELYSVMIHSGSGWGGHYYAYIKCFDTGKWYNFNDSNVSEISSKDLKKAYGETSSWGSSSSAYLLMYRKVDYGKNVIKISNEDMSKDVLASLEEQKKKTIEDEILRREELKKIVIRVKYNKEVRDVSIKNDEKIRTLKIASMSTHGILTGQENVRVREIDYNNSMTAVLSDEGTIYSSSLYHTKKIALEVKLDNEDFEDYDPNKISLKVVPWRMYPDTETSLEDIVENPQIVKFSKFGKVRDLIDLLCEKFEIPIGNLKVFKKGIYTYRYVLEMINFQSLNNERITNIGLYDNTLLLIEMLEDKTKKSKWQEVFELESAKCVIQLTTSYDYYNPNPNTYQVSIQPSKTIGELKTIISSKVNIPEENLILRFSSNLTEIKDLTQTIKQGISSNTNLSYSYGMPLQKNQIRVTFLLAEPSKKMLKDGEFFSFFPLFNMPANLDWKISNLKMGFMENLPKYYPSLCIRHYRLREIQAEKMSRWLDESVLIGDFRNQDEKKLAVEVIDQDDQVRAKDEILIAVKRFNANTWKLGDVTEIKVNSKITSAMFGEILSSKFGIQV